MGRVWKGWLSLFIWALLTPLVQPGVVFAEAPSELHYDPDLDPDPGASHDMASPGPLDGGSLTKKKPKRPLFRGTFGLGVGYDPNAGFLMTTAVRGRDLFRIDGLQLDLETRWSGAQLGAAMTFGYDPSHSPFFGRLKLSYQRDLFGLQEKGDDDLRSSTLGGFAEFGVKWARGWRASIRYKLFHRSMENGQLLQGSAFALPIDEWSRPQLQSALQLRLSYQSPNNRDPTSGMAVGARVLGLIEGSHLAMGSGSQYLKGELRASYATMLPGGLHLSFGLDAGVLVGQHDQIPFAMRYRMGGLYGRSSWLPDVGPRISGSHGSISLGGQGYGRVYTELRIPIVRKIGLYLFGALEAGAIVHQVASIPGAPGELALGASWTAAGIIGLLWRSPIGPLKFGFSIPFVRDHPSAPPVMFGFSLGQ